MIAGKIQQGGRAKNFASPIIKTKCWLACLFVSASISIPAWATEIELKPTFESKLLVITGTENVGDTDVGEARTAFYTPVQNGDSALTLNPGLTLSATGPVWNAQWSYKNTSIIRDGANEGRSSINNISLNNQISLMRDRLTVFANLTRNNRNIDNRRAGFSDPIFNSGEYIDVDTLNAGFTFRNVVSRDWRNQLNYQFSKTDFDEKELEETDATSTNLTNNDRQSASFTSQYGGRAQQLRGGLTIEAQTSERRLSGNQNSGTIAVNLGVPIWSSLDFVVNGHKTVYDIDRQNQDIELPNFDTEYYGVGLAWRFSNRSFIEVTRNRDTRGQTLFDQEKVDAEFTGARLVLKPNDRVSIDFDHSQRFYGESNSATINYTASRWSFNLNYRESLDTNSRLNRNVFSIGPHLCPELDSTAEDCEALEELPTERPDDGFLLELFDVEFFIQEELVLNKGGSAQFSYRNKKSNLSITYSENERQFLEREGNLSRNNEKSHSLSLAYQYQMSRRTSLSFDVSESKTDRLGRTGFSETESDDESKVKQTNIRTSLSLNRKLTRKATGTFTVSHTENKGRVFVNRLNGTRIELTYKYDF